MSDQIEKIRETLEKVAVEVVTLEKGDIPAMGEIMNGLGLLEDGSRELDDQIFHDLTKAIKGYLEKLVLSEVDDHEPLEEGISSLQSVHRCLEQGKEFTDGLSGLMKRLAGETEVAGENEPASGSADESAQGESGDDRVLHAQELSDEDKEIIGDFIIESQENLESIEVSLIDLEQEPDDLETINAIFRPFHTIKGVSGFLNLEKINRLSHSAENLLDKARNGGLQIDAPMIDIILESVDTLKKMIQGVQSGLETGGRLDNGIDIAPLLARIEETNSRADKTGDVPVGEILVQKGKISSEDLEESLERQRSEPDKKLGEILVEEAKIESGEVISALREQKKFNRQQVGLQVKVDTNKLDNLVDMTGELVIAQAMLRQNQVIISANDQKLLHNLGQLNQITSSLQTTAMSMRMVPIRNTFQKMVRLVRDLSRNSGKEVGLEMSGEDTEIDRNVVEELYEPMVHMIRNAVDHGIEPPERREANGKDRKGTIHLRAYQQGGYINIEIQDDGSGLDKARILEKARSKGLLSEENNLKDSEIYNLIFQAGFSTAKKVTDISGRGVGMDVVKKAIEKLRGRVEITSRPGRGSTFIIHLPLTLAIIEGMLVRVGKQRYIIPALAILESFRPEKNQYSTVEGKGEIISSRGRLIPLIRLARIFGVEGDVTDPWEGLVVAVEHDGEQRCLLLDELLGKEEVVIKSLGETLKDIKGIAGGAIMGDGRVGLILDIAGLFEAVNLN